MSSWRARSVLIVVTLALVAQSGHVPIDIDDPQSNLHPIHGDFDGDGITNAREVELGTNPLHFDSDGDGLTDRRELQLGTSPTDLDTDADGLEDDVEVRLDAADPLRRDVFVEIDYMTTCTGLGSAAETLRERFANAPVQNPDGTTGITLHLRFDDPVASHDDPITAHSVSGPENDLWDYHDEFSDPIVDGHSHYALLVANPYSDGEPAGGVASGNEFLVDCTLDDGVVGGLFMHELGHVLGLWESEHRGIDSYEIPYEAYPSVMNYDSHNLVMRYSDGDASPHDHDDWAVIADAMSE